MCTITQRAIIVPKLSVCPFEHPYGYVYLYTNSFNGHKYIGKHKFKEPYIDPHYKGSGGPHWKNALEKYGWENFIKEVLFWLEENPEISELKHNNILNEQEIYFIDLLGTFDNPEDYNETYGGDGISGDLLRGNSNPMYGRSGELNPMYGKRGEQSPWWGREHTEEERAKISKANLGKPCTQETRNKIARANAGHPPSELQKRKAFEVCSKRVGENNPMWKGGHKIINEEHSKRMKGIHCSPQTEFTSENSSGAKNSQAKSIVQLSKDGKFIQRYDYVGEPCRLFPNEFRSVEIIRKCCKGRQLYYMGYRWMYEKDYLEQERSE